MNVVIYARYSSDRQTEQSIDGQLKECYEYAQRNGYAVIGEYINIPSLIRFIPFLSELFCAGFSGENPGWEGMGKELYEKFLRF